MKQLTQLLKNGKMEILEVPAPVVEDGRILVKTHFSVISAGTEGKTVSDARANYLAKARSRKKELLAVIEMAKNQGLLETYKIVMNKLETPATLGYSASGQVIAVGKDIFDIKPSDWVACAGLEACHAEIISVPYNLCVKVSNPENIKSAAFVALGAIAMQGIRRADVKLGENVLVIGLGTIGLITIQLLNISGCRSFGIDIDEWAVQKAIENGAHAAYCRNKAGLESLLLEQTQGIGFDSVIITAGTSSLDPINIAGRLCRKKGKVVVVGAIPTGYDREHYYRKEIDLLMSTSYGPGRYDKNYEEKGLDYPIAYVRWTEKRNMQAFIELIENNKINLSKIITHTFKLDNAVEAYNMILNKSEKFSGIILSYNEEVNFKNCIQIKPFTPIPSKGNIGFIGAGSFAQNMLLPYVSKITNLVTVATSHGNTSYYVAKKFGFSKATTDVQEILNDSNIDTVFITTRHNTHGQYVISSLQAGKHVFVEKPLCITNEELEKIKENYQNSKQILLVGFNRRFSPFSQMIYKNLSPSEKKAINIRINAGYIPPEHWTQDLQVGGGRIIGEVCHFVDLAMFFAQSKIKEVFAQTLDDSNQLMDTLSIILKFDNGSIANISYFSNGSKKVPKELIEVFSSENTWIIDDFKKMFFASRSVKKYKLYKQDKGHKNEIEAFMYSVKNGTSSPISFEDIYISTKTTFAVLESIKQRKIIEI
jgi:polar amino acid transport system substrate-binding protein